MDLSAVYTCAPTGLDPPAPGLVAIYGLYDPRGGGLRYVGKSLDPHRRLLAHCRERHPGSSHRKNWVAALIAAGVRPVMHILAWVEPQDWVAAEQHFIDLARRTGCQLTNNAPGGRGGRLKGANAGRYKGRKQPPEAIAKTAAANLGRKNTPEALARMRAVHHNKPWTEAEREAHRKIVMTAEWRANLGAAHRGLKRTPEQRAYQAARTREALARPEVRAKLRDARRRTVEAKRAARLETSPAQLPLF